MDKRLSFLIAGIFLVVALTNFISAEVLTHNPTTTHTAQFAGTTIKTWQNVTIRGSNIYVQAIRKNSSNTATTAYVMFPNRSIIGEVSFIGDWANFSSPRPYLAANFPYLIAVDNGGSSYTATGTGEIFPYNTTRTSLIYTSANYWYAPEVQTDNERFVGFEDLVASDSDGGSSVGGVDVNLLEPSDNYIMNSSLPMSIKYNITNDNGGITYNATIRVWNSAGSVVYTNTTTYEDANNHTANFTGTLESYGTFTYNVQILYNESSSGIMTSNITSNRTIKNGFQINIIDQDGAMISDGVIYIDNVFYSSNQVEFPTGSMENLANQTQTFNISARSNGGYYQQNDTSLVVNVSNSTVYNITLNAYQLDLTFYWVNGTAVNVSGYITDLLTSYTFSNTSYLRNQGNLSNDLIYIRFVNTLIGGNVSWLNKSQFYEYDNSEGAQITENISIFDNIDTSSYFQTQDNSGNIIKNALIRIYGVVPSTTANTEVNYAFFGQRITNDNGLTVFPLDSNMEIYLTITATGYQTKTIRLTASEITTFTADDPLIIRMGKSAYNQKDNVFLSDLWKINGTKVYPSYFDDLSADYFMFIYDYEGRALKYSTNYEGINRSITLDGTTKSGIISLASGQQFSSSNNATWYIYIWADDVLTYTIAVNFNQETTEIIFNVDDLGLDSNDAWKVVVFLGLILTSSLMGILFRTPEGDAGVHTFFIGGFVSSLAVAGMGWLTITGVFHYLGKLIKKWISE